MDEELHLRRELESYEVGIPCGKNLCAQCCIQEFEVCGASIDCDDMFTIELFMVLALVAVFLGGAMAYLLLIHYLGGQKYFDRMSQVILDKQYRKMKAEKSVGITIGISIQKNAPIKSAEIIEGLSDVEPEGGTVDEREHVGTILPSNALYFDFSKFKDQNDKFKAVTEYIKKRDAVLKPKITSPKYDKLPKLTQMSIIMEQTGEVDKTVSPGRFLDLNKEFVETTQFFSQQVGANKHLIEEPKKYLYDPKISKTMNMLKEKQFNMIHKIDELKKESQVISPSNDLSNRIGKLSIPLDNNTYKSEVSGMSKLNNRIVKNQNSVQLSSKPDREASIAQITDDDSDESSHRGQVLNQGLGMMGKAVQNSSNMKTDHKKVAFALQQSAQKEIKTRNQNIDKDKSHTFKDPNGFNSVPNDSFLQPSDADDQYEKSATQAQYQSAKINESQNSESNNSEARFGHRRESLAFNKKNSLNKENKNH